jgi:glutamate-ammonia-ligase adenylyltransferase
MTRCPDAYDPTRGAQAAALMSDHPALQPLIAGAAGCSPYLEGLIQREADWLRGAIDTPEQALESILTKAGTLTVDALTAGLRQGKRRVALLAGLADLAGVWSLSEVTTALTRFADMAVHCCLTRLTQAEIARGKLPGQTDTDSATAGGMFALAMGKMGAFELNYSSDIDLICLFDETRYNPDDYHDARAAFIRVTRRMTAILSDIKTDGYVFRTDLRLRPDASVTPVCISTEMAERYYESVGRTWERAAFIKARGSGGDLAAADRFLTALTPFVWRKHLDFAAIQDAHDMRLRIRAHKGLGGPITLSEHNMKLGRGGIREIEFFTQTRQLISGGRDSELRSSGTLNGLARLADKGWVPQDVAQVLSGHYAQHREIEHRLQMINDAQTHLLPKDGAGFDRLAAFMGQSVSMLKTSAHDALAEVHELTEGFFAPAAAPPEPEFGRETTQRWHSYPALRSDRAVAIFDRLRPGILKKLMQAARPEEALSQFDGFLAGLPAGVQLFSLFDANPQLVDLVVDICATAPALSRYLSRNAGVFDAVIGGAFFAPWPELSELQLLLDTALAQAGDYEAQLDGARLFFKEWHFRIGVHYLRGLISADEAGAEYSDLAETVVAGIWPLVLAQFATKHGAAPGRGAVVLGMGSLGAGRLHAASDLDLIMIYDADGVEMSEGRRPLNARAYYARLTQALLTALTAPMTQGRMYEVDMRLRPSGRQGPVATSITSLESYQRTEAWTWEHLALTRARVIAGPPALGDEVEAIRRAVLQEKATGADILVNVADMRTRIAEAKPPEGPWDAKIGAGRLQDIELFAQSLALRAGSPARILGEQLAGGVASGLIEDADRAALEDAAAMLWRLQSAAKLLTEGNLNFADVGAGGTDFVLRENGAQSIETLDTALQQATTDAAAAIARNLGQPTTGESDETT